ncbi:MAG: Sir2 family NAD-dependent protein deacetylase [Bordetella sp.]|nr:Sir2 family NAD-dependent protein deacetylase [Bordetella sp.]
MPHIDPAHALARATDLVARASSLLVVAGAGMGVDSGLPDFRGREGLWRAYPALGRRRMDFTDIASPQAFHEDAALAWGFYGHRLARYRETAPHAGFGLLRAWGRGLPQGVAAFTSNVDGQFQRAGFDDVPLTECHGSLHHLQCLLPCSDAIWSADDFVPVIDPQTGLLTSAPPRCPRCGALARPNVLMFGDYDWLGTRTDAQFDALEPWLGAARELVVIEIGAGTAVATARAFTQRVARACGAAVIRINRDDAGISGDARHVPLKMSALAALRGIEALRAA